MNALDGDMDRYLRFRAAQSMEQAACWCMPGPCIGHSAEWRYSCQSELFGDWAGEPVVRAQHQLLRLRHSNARQSCWIHGYALDNMLNLLNAAVSCRSSVVGLDVANS
jgi:hypothetical protein